ADFHLIAVIYKHSAPPELQVKASGLRLCRAVESSVFLSAVNPHSCEMKPQRKYQSRIASPLAFPTANRSALLRSHNCRRSSPRRKWDKALYTFRRKAHDPAA